MSGGATPLLVLATSLLALFYEIYFIYKYGYTLGKYMTGIQVISIDGNTLSFKTSFIRTIVKILSGLPLSLGYIWYFFNGQKQTWHDIIAETIVINKKDELSVIENLKTTTIVNRKKENFKITIVSLSLAIFILSLIYYMVSEIDMAGFELKASYPFGDIVKEVTLYDFDNDGRDNLIFLEYTDDSIDICIMDMIKGNIEEKNRFKLKQYATSPIETVDIKKFSICDLDNDGKTELITMVRNREKKDPNIISPYKLNIYRLQDNSFQFIASSENVTSYEFLDFEIIERNDNPYILCLCTEESLKYIKQYIFLEDKFEEINSANCSVGKQIIIGNFTHEDKDTIYIVGTNKLSEIICSDEKIYVGDSIEINSPNKFNSSYKAMDIDDDSIDELLIYTDGFLHSNENNKIMLIYKYKNNKFDKDFTLRKKISDKYYFHPIGKSDLNNDGKEEVIFKSGHNKFSATLGGKGWKILKEYRDMLSMYHIKPFELKIIKFLPFL